jgi:hypothetical protein
LSSLLPQERAESGSTVQGGSIFAESLEQRNSGGVQGGSTVQGIGSALEKNKISFFEEPSLEKSLTVALAGVSEGGQDEYRVDSCNLTQSKVNCGDTPDYTSYPHLTCDNIDAKRNQAEDIKERLLKAQTKQDLTLIREEYTGRCDWVWKNLLTKAQRRTLKEITAIEQLNLLATPQAIASPETLQDDWLSEENLAGFVRDLNDCEDSETLQFLRECWHPQAMNAACKLLSPEKHAQIKEWVVKLNSENAPMPSMQTLMT